MATRKIKDAKDLATNELIYFKGHAKATYMSDGRNVEEAIHQIGTGGGGGITAETDPIFSASPAASITEEKKAEWDDKVDKVSGKQLSTEDFTSALKTKLEGLNNYDDTELSEALSTLRGDFDALVSGDTTIAIKSFNDIIAFLEGIQDTQDLSSIIASIQQQIAGKMDKVTLAKVATSGSYNDLTDKPTIPTSAPKLVIPSVTVADLEQVVTSGEQTLIFGDTGDLAYYLNHNYPIYIKYDADYEYPSLFQVYGFFDGDQYYLYTLVGNQQYTIEIYTSTTPCYVERSIIPYSLKTVNGESIIGEGNIQIAGGDEPYITTCTVGDLRKLVYGVVDRIAFDPRGIEGALSENKRVLMPYSTTSSNGYYSVVGRSQGDVLYLTVVSNAEAFDIQTPLNYQDLEAGNITRLVIPSEDQIGDATIHQLAFDFPMVYDVFEEGQYEVNSEDYGTFFDTADVGIIAEKIRTGNVVVAVVDDHDVYQLLPATVWFDEQNAEFNILVYSHYSKYWYEILMNLQSGYQSIKRYKNYIEGSSSAYPQIDADFDGDTFDIFPNTFYVFGEKTDLDINFIDAESSGNGGKACEYLFQFTSGSEGTTLVLDDDIKWTSELVIEPNKIYQISILNGLGTVMSWDNAPNLTENHITYNEGDFMNGGTIIFEYPTASELTFTMAHYSSPELVIEEGTTQVSIDWHEPLAPIIQNISPDRDSTYIYIY